MKVSTINNSIGAVSYFGAIIGLTGQRRSSPAFLFFKVFYLLLAFSLKTMARLY